MSDNTQIDAPEPVVEVSNLDRWAEARRQAALSLPRDSVGKALAEVEAARTEIITMIENRTLRYAEALQMQCFRDIGDAHATVEAIRQTLKAKVGL